VAKDGRAACSGAFFHSQPGKNSSDSMIAIGMKHAII
jgi:hypothetical protein